MAESDSSLSKQEQEQDHEQENAFRVVVTGRPKSLRLHIQEGQVKACDGKPASYEESRRNRFDHWTLADDGARSLLQRASRRSDPGATLLGTRGRSGHLFLSPAPDERCEHCP